MSRKPPRQRRVRNGGSEAKCSEAPTTGTHRANTQATQQQEKNKGPNGSEAQSEPGGGRQFEHARPAASLGVSSDSQHRLECRVTASIVRSTGSISVCRVASRVQGHDDCACHGFFDLRRQLAGASVGLEGVRRTGLPLQTRPRYVSCCLVELNRPSCQVFYRCASPG